MIDISELKTHIYDVVGALHEVHKELGPGLNEYCYQEGLQLQLTEVGIPFQREKLFHPTYHGCTMETVYRLDFLCKDNIIVECKSVSELVNNHRAQFFNYLRLTKCACGILVNFAPAFAVIERYFYDKDLQEILTVDGQRVKTLK
ncbi:MAG: GxxExxY protein [Prevotella sp.]|nr:GxxExxY protein [Prevotella sp.]